MKKFYKDRGSYVYNVSLKQYAREEDYFDLDASRPALKLYGINEYISCKTFYLFFSVLR